MILFNLDINNPRHLDIFFNQSICNLQPLSTLESSTLESRTQTNIGGIYLIQQTTHRYRHHDVYNCNTVAYTCGEDHLKGMRGRPDILEGAYRLEYYHH